MNRAPHQFEKFHVETIARSRMKAAVSFARKPVTLAQQRQLCLSIKQFGFTGAIIWNKRTGNIIAGSRCISVLDALHGGADYSLDVAVVDLNEAMEKALNAIL
jgi:hypothetical protein